VGITFKAHLARHVLLTVMNARAALNAPSAMGVTMLTRMVAAQRVQIYAASATVQQSVLTVRTALASLPALLLASHAVLPTALVALTLMCAKIALMETY